MSNCTAPTAALRSHGAPGDHNLNKGAAWIPDALFKPAARPFRSDGAGANRC